MGEETSSSQPPSSVCSALPWQGGGTGGSTVSRTPPEVSSIASTRDSFFEPHLWPLEAVRAEMAYCLRLQGLDAQFCLDRELCEAKHRGVPANIYDDGTVLLETLLCIALQKIDHQPTCSLLCIPNVGEAFELVIALEKAKRHRENRVKLSGNDTLTAYQKALLPVDMSGYVTSVGSFEHSLGTCRPCAFHDNPKKSAVCCNGIMCAFCHFPHILRRKPKGGAASGLNNSFVNTTAATTILSESEAPRWLISAANCVAAVVSALVAAHNRRVAGSVPGSSVSDDNTQQPTWSSFFQRVEDSAIVDQRSSLGLLSSSTTVVSPFCSLPSEQPSISSFARIFGGGGATPSSVTDFVPSPATSLYPEFNSDFDHQQQIQTVNLDALVQNLVNKLNTSDDAATAAAAEVLLNHIPKENT